MMEKCKPHKQEMRFPCCLLFCVAMSVRVWASSSVNLSDAGQSLVRWYQWNRWERNKDKKLKVTRDRLVGDTIFTSGDITVGKLLHVVSYRPLSSEVSGDVCAHGARVTSKHSRRSPESHFPCAPSSTPACVSYRDTRQHTQSHTVDFIKLEDMEEVWPRKEGRKEVEHTPGSEQKAARKRGLWQAHTHTHIVKELQIHGYELEHWPWHKFMKCLNRKATRELTAVSLISFTIHHR